jgi:putative thiamine transport system permease protein
MRRSTRWAGAAPLVLLFMVPLAISLALLLPGLFDVASFKALLAHPQFFGALALTLFTGITSTMLSLGLAILIVMAAPQKPLSHSSWFLALPHLALALGLGFVLAPTGLLARLLVGGASPPDWQLVQDPFGFGLILALVLKETPFLVWAMLTVMHSDDRSLHNQSTVARSLGHGPRSLFMKVVLPQVLPRIIWPLVAVFSYGMTVVDMAFVIGPGQPPSLAQLLWTDLNNGDVINNSRGAAGTLLLSGLVFALLVLIGVMFVWLKPGLRKLLTRPARPERRFTILGQGLWSVLVVAYGLVILALLLQSITQLWPYPQLVAEHYSMKAWAALLQNPSPLITSFTLAFTTALVAVLSVVVWFETQPSPRDKIVLAVSVLILCVPALLVALGHYRLLLWLGLTGTVTGLFLAHLLPVTAYVFIMLQGPYRGYDRRWKTVGQGLGAAGLKFNCDVKWPMLKGPLLSAAAVGFAVSSAQFIGAQLAAAGRFSTLPMEAVTLSSGGNRALISSYGVLLMLLPLAGFAVSAWLSKSRWRDA